MQQTQPLLSIEHTKALAFAAASRGFMGIVCVSARLPLLPGTSHRGPHRLRWSSGLMYTSWYRISPDVALSDNLAENMAAWQVACPGCTFADLAVEVQTQAMKHLKTTILDAAPWTSITTPGAVVVDLSEGAWPLKRWMLPSQVAGLMDDIKDEATMQTSLTFNIRGLRLCLANAIQAPPLAFHLVNPHLGHLTTSLW